MNGRGKTTASAYCPDCDGIIYINPRPQAGQRFVCPHCDTELEVVSSHPLELDWASSWSDEEENDSEWLEDQESW
jgi:lysine biosynthesis protein LysW